MKESPEKIDPLLEPLLTEVSDEQADELLLQLISLHAGPVAKGVIRYKLRLGANPATQTDAEDIYQDVVLQLLIQLQNCRRLPNEHPITDLRGIAAVIAHRTCSRWMRRQYPERHALKNRLHYLLTRQRGLALWHDEDGKLLGGFAEWQTQNKGTNGSKSVDELTQRIGTCDAQDLADAIVRLFNQLGRPLEFDRLVSALATILGVRDQPIESLDAGDEPNAIAAANQPDHAWQIEKRMFLKRLWEELQQLPLNQRAALLLNLKDVSGGCITLFPTTGIATVRQLAAALEMTSDDFARLWNQLPIEDSRIAELLGLTRQQVINARKSGRERLARRLKGFF